MFMKTKSYMTELMLLSAVSVVILLILSCEKVLFVVPALICATLFAVAAFTSKKYESMSADKLSSINIFILAASIVNFASYIYLIFFGGENIERGIYIALYVCGLIMLLRIIKRIKRK